MLLLWLGCVLFCVFAVCLLVVIISFVFVFFCVCTCLLVARLVHFVCLVFRYRLFLCVLS